MDVLFLQVCDILAPQSTITPEVRGVVKKSIIAELYSLQEITPPIPERSCLKVNCVWRISIKINVYNVLIRVLLQDIAPPIPERKYLEESVWKRSI